MKKLTNHTPGARGVNTKAGTVWIESGQTVEIKADDIIGDLPDLGKPSDAPASDDADLIAAVQAENADLKAQVADLQAQIAKFDKDGDGKPGGSKPKE